MKTPRRAAPLRENILSLSALQAMNYIAPLVTVPYLVRVLGPVHYGLLTFAQALVIYFDAITGYGFSLSATRAVAGCRERPAEVACVFWDTIYARAVLMLASAGMLTAAVAAVPRLRATPWVFGAAFLTVMGTAVFPVWFFQGLEQMRYITLAQAFARILSIPALLLLVARPEDYVRAAVIQGSVPLVASAVAAPAVWSRLKTRPPRPRAAVILRTLRDGWSLFVTQMAFVLSTGATTVVLGFVAGAAAVGYYSAADKLIRAVSSLLGPVAQALYPHLSGLKAQSLELTFRTMRKTFGWIAALALAASVATYLLAPRVGPVIWGAGFAPSVLVVRWLSPLPLVFALINIFGTQTMVVFEMDALVSRTALAGAALNLILVWILSSRFGAAGAAAGTVTAGTLISASLAWTSRTRFAALRSSREPVCAS